MHAFQRKSCINFLLRVQQMLIIMNELYRSLFAEMILCFDIGSVLKSFPIDIAVGPADLRDQPAPLLDAASILLTASIDLLLSQEHF